MILCRQLGQMVLSWKLRHESSDVRSGFYVLHEVVTATFGESGTNIKPRA